MQRRQTGRDDEVMCVGKKQFPSYWAAARSAREMNRYRGSKGNPYRCPTGRHFHVGNTLGKMKSRRPSRHTLKEGSRYGRK